MMGNVHNNSPVYWDTVSPHVFSMEIYVRGTYRQTQLFYWLIIG